MSEPSGPLEGIRVLDLTTMISGPIATRILGDQGADVIKIEAPGAGDLVRHMGIRRGGDLSATFVSSNRNKRSIVLDLKTEPGRAVLFDLVRSADVFVQNFRPGTAERMGLGEAALRALRSDLVYVSISGFGDTGPYANKRVYDPLIQALSGLADVQRDRGTNRPRMVRTIVPDKLTAVTAAQAITAALFSRTRTGKGQHVRLAMLDAMVAFLWPEAFAELTFPDHQSRHGQRGSLAPELIYETADGFITAGAVSDSEWQGLCRALERPEWLEDERFDTPGGRVANAEERLTLTAEVMATRTTEAWLERLDAEQVPCAPILRRWDLPDHPQIAANQLIREVEHPRAGPMREARPAARFSAGHAEDDTTASDREKDDTTASDRGKDDTTASDRENEDRPAPGLGEHTDEVLGEAGYSPDAIRTLRASGAIA